VSSGSERSRFSANTRHASTVCGSFSSTNAESGDGAACRRAAHTSRWLAPLPAAATARGCRIEIDFTARDSAVVAHAAAAGVVEFVGLKRVRAAFPERLPVTRGGIALAARPGGLTLSIALEILLGADRRHGAALILAARTGEGAEAESHISPTLIIERGEAPPLQRAKRTPN
jgi:hypothetical protein